LSEKFKKSKDDAKASTSIFENFFSQNYGFLAKSEVFKQALIINPAEAGLQVLKATHTKSVRLIIEIPIDCRVGRIQIAIPGRTAASRRRPKVGVRGTIIETASRITVAG
jgi:hypothetical protein